MCGSWWSQWKAFQRFWWQVQQAAQSRKSSSTDQGDLEKFWNQGRKNHVGGLLVARRTPRQAAGKCAGNPSFRSWLKTSDKSFGKDAQASFPRAIMLHHYFHGDADAFNQALASGDITEVNQGGKVMYSFDTYESGRAKNSDQRVEKYVRDICERYWRVSSEDRR